MSPKPLTYRVQVGGFSIWVREVAGSEHLSQAWRLELGFGLDPQTMTGLPEAFDPDDIVKQEMELFMERDGVVRILSGIVTRVTLSATLSGVPEVKMVIEPRLSLLKHRRDVRIHRDLTVPQIVEEVCSALGVKVEQRLSDSYESRPYCVQWRETDYDYVMRLMEDEGIFYFFTAGDVMVMGDNPGAYEPVAGNATIMFRHLAGADQNYDCVHHFGTHAALTPGKVTLRDWNTEHPSLDMDVSSNTDDDSGPEWYDYPGEYEEPAQGTRKARLHAEAFDRASDKAQGQSSTARIYPGTTFTLVDTPFNTDDGAYVVRSIEHDWDLTKTGFMLAFEAQGAEKTYRPPRSTYVPRILNPHTGFVTVSYPGEDIYCDHFGRVKVHFHWDRLRPMDDDCSHWIPVQQDNTGGSSSVPREGWEVVVHYLEGDPDRPMVMGRTFNPEDKFSERLPTEKARTSMKSESSPTRDGSNEIRFDDKAGREEVYLHAELDQQIEVGNNKDVQIGSNDVSYVNHDETISISGNSTWTIGGACNWDVDNDQSYTIGGDRTLTVACADNRTVCGNNDLTIGGDHEIECDLATSVSCKTMTETIAGDLKQTCKTTHQTEVGGTLKLDIGGSLMEKVALSKADSATEERTETIAGDLIVKADDEYQMRCDETRTITVTGKCLAKAAKELTLTGAKRFDTHSPTATYNGTTDIVLKVKNTTITMKDGLVFIDAPQSISLLISGKNNQGASKSTQN